MVYQIYSNEDRRSIFVYKISADNILKIVFDISCKLTPDEDHGSVNNFCMCVSRILTGLTPDNVPTISFFIYFFKLK